MIAFSVGERDKKCYTKIVLGPDPSSNSYEGVSQIFRTGRLQQELQMVQLFAITCS